MTLLDELGLVFVAHLRRSASRKQTKNKTNFYGIAGYFIQVFLCILILLIVTPSVVFYIHHFLNQVMASPCSPVLPLCLCVRVCVSLFLTSPKVAKDIDPLTGIKAIN